MVDAENPGIEELTAFAMDVIRSQAAIALEYYGKGDPRVKFDDALVTEAENRLSETFQQKLQARFPEHRLFGDAPVETGYLHGERGFLWVYDALDGVANFQGGIPLWGTSLALYENFWPIFGVFYMPVTDYIFHARAGGRAYWGDTPIRIPEQRDEINNESVLLTYSRFNNHYRTTFPGKIRNYGSAATHISHVARGRAEAAIIANASYQDLAAAQILLEAAGGRLLTIDGRKLQLHEYLESQRIEDHVIALPHGTFEQFKVYLNRVA
jgi:myo-inositol-1(or 4)-monophosphatase